MSIPAPFQQVWGTNGVMESSFPRQITVAACQVRPGSDVDENLELARRSVADAAARGAQIVVLPEATMVRFGVDPRPVAQPLDGPFAEAKELLCGFWIWQVRSFDEAVEWLKRAPFDGGAEIELRPVFEMEDFGEVLTPELREQEERVRAEAAKLAS